MPTVLRIARLIGCGGAAGAKAIAVLARKEWPYLVCAALALVTIWGHRFPVGVDLPQHANLFRITREMTLGPAEFRGLYRINPFTPYLLTYVVAYPFALLFGAIAAAKCLLSLAALATPIMMRRWLGSIGARQEFGLLGFLLAFDLPYYWGFISHEMAIPLAFLYLEAFERQGVRPGWRAILRTMLSAIALFFCHGITFGVLTMVVGARLLLRRRPLAAWRAGLHALPGGLMAIFWSQVNRGNSGQKAGDDWVNLDRLVRLFSAPFATTPDRFWAVVSVIGIVLILLAAWPRIVLQGRRVVPLLVAIVLFLSLPDTLADTWMIGSRFCVYAHAFAPALLLPRNTGWLARLWPRVVLVWVVFVFVTLNVRLVAFNQESAGLWELKNHMQHGFDIHTMLPDTAHDSETMGFMQFHHAAGWITAECGGLLHNDSPDYYQMPIRRGATPFPSFFRYIVAKGNASEITRKITENWKSARLVHQASSWLLFEDPPAGNDEFTVIRSLQSWGELGRDRAVSGGPLTIAGTHFEHGLGTHADGLIRVRIDKSGGIFSGACGLDDGGGSGGMAMFFIRDDDGEILFESGEIRSGEPARRFSVSLAGRKELILEVRKVETINYTHSDWVDLKVTPM
jgi:hypothetical protein